MKTGSMLLATAGLMTLLSGPVLAQEGSTVAFLMPDQASTRYEKHDYPGFKAEMAKLCASCKVIYQNANADAALQQQQFNSVIAQGAKVVVLDPVDSAAAAALVEIAQSQGLDQGFATDLVIARNDIEDSREYASRGRRFEIECRQHLQPDFGQVRMVDEAEDDGRFARRRVGCEPGFEQPRIA